MENQTEIQIINGKGRIFPVTSTVVRCLVDFMKVNSEVIGIYKTIWDLLMAGFWLGEKHDILSAETALPAVEIVIMIYFATDVDQLLQAVQGLKKAGAIKTVRRFEDQPEPMIQLELVYIDENGQIVGEESEDYIPKNNECMAILIS